MDEWKDKLVIISWDEFRRHAYHLSNHIKAHNQQFDLIVAIARGGLTLSQLLSDFLSLPIAAFTIQSYKDYVSQENTPQINHGLTSSLVGKKILLVDDVSDTGKTFLRGISYLEELGAKRADITTCAMSYKPHAKHKPDFFVHETTAWIIYPYEAQEALETIGKTWHQEGIAADEIKTRLLSFGLLPEQIDTFISTL